ncbi:MAG: hypothetical protein NXI31_03110 [bacterium]|nr:hypothetical protein [bacterium]
MTGSRRIWPWLLATLVVLGLMLAASLTAISATNAGSRALLAEWLARYETRPPSYRRDAAVHGATTAEDALARYEAAATHIDERLSGYSWDASTRRLLQSKKTISAAAAAALRAEFAPAFLLQQGAHGVVLEPPDNSSWALRYGLTRALLLEVDARLTAGTNVEAAIELWLDGVTFCIDVAPLQANSFVLRQLDALLMRLDQGELERLPPPWLGRLSRTLATLDELFAPPPDPRAPIAWWAPGLLNGSLVVGGEPLGLEFYAWRHGFDAEAAEIAGLAALAERAALLEPPAKDTSERLDQWQAFDARPGTATGWIYGHALDSIRGRELVHRRALARLRLLRLATTFLAGEPPPKLADPFAPGNLKVVIEGARATCRCTEAFAGNSLAVERR